MAILGSSGDATLGRRLIMMKSDAYASELHHGEEGCSELVIAGGDAPEAFEFIEKMSDKIALLQSHSEKKIGLLGIVFGGILAQLPRFET